MSSVTSQYLVPAWFGGDVVRHARDLIGRELHVRSRSDDSVVHGIIVETEAYGGADDPASHAAFRPGGKARAMFGPPGMIYVYAAYGMYPCLNIVTGAVGCPSAVLIRGIRPLPEQTAVLGPGRTSRVLGITLEDNGRTIGDGRIEITVARTELEIVVGPRVGITRAVDRPWRFMAVPQNTRSR